ncbi:MAG TPA: bifunctional demethylmenaquinone methyltransferase/2-methoxy-6-polyprenyl-1,4-benzoquinol methylase UbiE [Deinococcales bacterium]|nr:bifunctional demethylmenaquinone methyltransferase/2-methoxy-6-polyprenyl-1,4-benzoquinol methylase UbiE [Deinococcales bacterium]
MDQEPDRGRDAPPAGPQAGKAEKVQAMFDSIAGRYDLLNRVLSMGVDRGWRTAAAREALAEHPRAILDVATGTADFALTLKRLSPTSRVVGVDFAARMLEIGREKAARQNLDVRLDQGDALDLPYEDGSFDALTCAFGFRNFADFGRGLSEFHRVLGPGGRAVILEFPPPPKGLVGRAYRLYFLKVLPLVGGVISGKPQAYSYLPDSVLAFPEPDELKRLMEAAGFQTRYRLLTSGLAAVHVGVKR